MDLSSLFRPDIPSRMRTLLCKPPLNLYATDTPVNSSTMVASMDPVVRKKPAISC
jgi:hypothetical protein